MQTDISLPRIIGRAFAQGRDRGLDMVTQQRMAVAAVRAVRPDLEEGEVVSMVEREEGQVWSPPLPTAASATEATSAHGGGFETH